MSFSGLAYKLLPQGMNKYLFVYMLITLLPGFVYSGFVLEFVHNEIYDISPKLPTLKSNIIKFLKNGIKYLTVSLTYTVILLLILALVCLTLGILTGIISGVLMATNTLEYKQIGSILFFLWITLFIIILVPTLPIVQTAFASYADNYSFKFVILI